MDGLLPDEECWEYLDPKGKKQGPFTASRMAVWYEHGMLPQDLGVRFAPSMPFVPIRELFKPPAVPFRSAPQRPTPAPPAPKVASPAAPVLWQYIDTKGQLQGPFPTPQMLLWHEHGMLPKSLRLRRTVDPEFRTIEEYFPQPMLPFKSTCAASSPSKSKETAQASAASAKKAAAPPQNGSFPAPLANLFASAAAAAAIGVPATAPAPKQKGEGKPSKGKGKGGQRQTDEDASGEAPKKGRGKANKEQANGWSWTDQGWAATDKSWWEWSSWNGWSETGASGEGWENGKQSSTEWKGQDGAPIGAIPYKEKGEKGSAAVQAAFGNLSWGPASEASHLFPEEILRRVLDEGIVWEERWVSPLAVRFSQGKIHPFFHERGPISEVMLQIKCTGEQDGTSDHRRWIDPPFPPIRLLHLKEQGVLVTLDNRRLYALQRFALQEWPTPCLVRALCVDELTPTRLRAENRKFTNRLCGLQLEVESRSNAFDTFSWVTEAAHAEAPKFCRPAAFRAADKMVSLFPALLVHALLCHRLRPLLRSRWPLLRFLAITLPNPQRREFASKRVLLQHVLELSRPIKEVFPMSPAACISYKSETVVSLSKGRSNVTSRLSVEKPLKLVQASSPLSNVQRSVLAALMPMFCLPYARSALRGDDLVWVVTFLLAWGKVAAWRLNLPERL